MADATCVIADCGRAHLARGWCALHYERWRRNGHPLTQGVRRVDGSPETRFRARVRTLETGCWIWTGTINTAGYGQFWNGKRVVYAHRWAYERFIGPIPEDRPHLDHLCRTTACCNPAHLEPVTQRENNRRTRLTGCRRGHAYPEHEYRDPNGRRWCRQCRRDRDRARQEAS